jgi:hypothetical protein
LYNKLIAANNNNNNNNNTTTTNNNNNNNSELQKQIQMVKTFSDDIHMEFGLDKCAKIAFKRGKLAHSQNLVIDINRNSGVRTRENIQIPRD